MTRIKMLLFFTTLSSLPEPLTSSLPMLVREEYCRIFSAEPNETHVALYDGRGKNVGADIVLLIASDKKYCNEGLLRKNLRQAVSKRLLQILPGSAGFGGRIACADDPAEEEVPERLAQSTEYAQSTENMEFREQQSRIRELDPDSYASRAAMYCACEPKYSFDMVKLPVGTIEAIDQALGRMEYEQQVFSEWGLYAIMPTPVSALSFYGPPGTGKTMAAEAVAHRLGKRIIRASYADIENKYVGEGPKNVKALFLAAEQQHAALFIDEADSLLSKRLTNVSDGSGQAINSMRSQLLISLEQFHGIVMFATNLVVNYDRAFLSRLIPIPFELPDAAMREEIWKAHLYPRVNHGVRLSIPLADDLNLQEIAQRYELCGREIRNAVVNACVGAWRGSQETVSQACLMHAAQAELRRRQEAAQAGDHTAWKGNQTEKPEAFRAPI